MGERRFLCGLLLVGLTSIARAQEFEELDESSKAEIRTYLSEADAETEAHSTDLRKTRAKHPSDWHVLTFPLLDSLGKHKPCPIEVIRIAYESTKTKQSAILLVPGLFQNGFIFDILSEEGISYARWLMREKGLQPYLLNMRGLGDSCYMRGSNLDDLAVDDLPQAIEFVAKQVEKDRIYVLGHSMGGIVLEASLAGLARCGKKTCFYEAQAAQRAKYLRAAAILGVNVDLAMKSRLPPMKIASFLEYLVTFPTTAFVDRLPISFSSKMLRRALSPIPGSLRKASPTYWGLLRYVYSFENVSERARNAFIDRAVDSSTRGILHQYAVGMRKNGIRNSSGERYSDHLKNLRVPVVQGSFELDALASPELVERDNFSRLGAKTKRHFVFKGQGHEDFLLNADFHGSQSDLIDWMIEHSAPAAP